MPVIVSFCASEFVLRGRLTLLALRLPFHMRFRGFAAHLLSPAAVSIPKVSGGCHQTDGHTFIPEVTNDQLSQGFVVCQER